MGFWSGLVLRLFLGLGVCIVVGFSVSLVAGIAAGCVLLFSALLSHWRLLSRLRRWLEDPRPETFPDAGGTWGALLATLYRAQRDQERNRAHLSATVERFRQVADALPDGVILVDADVRIEWFNPVAQEQFSLDPSRDAGTPVTHFIRQPGFAEFVKAGMAREAMVIRAAAPSDRLFSVVALPFTDSGRLLLSRDVTQVERVETMRRDFVANVSHELRTPLTVIMGFLEPLLQEEGPDEATRQRFFAMMKEQAERMNRLVEDLLTLSRLESGNRPQQEQTVNVGLMVSMLAEEARAYSAGRHEIVLAAGDERLIGNAEELRSAFSNLVVNAVRYTPGGGRITLRWGLEEGVPVFSVEDSGIGIAPEHIPRLTERFYRVDKGRSNQTGGTGLGLAIVKHVLLRHQATLRIRSAPGQGSVFSAVFPAGRLAAAD